MTSMNGVKAFSCYCVAHLISHSLQTKKSAQSHTKSIQSDIPLTVYLSRFVTNWIENYI